MPGWKFKAVRLQTVRREEIKTTLEAHKINVLVPATDNSDQDEILAKCQEIEQKTGIPVNELASYFYLLALEEEVGELSPIERYILNSRRNIYTDPASVVHQKLV